jgi:hypothetical protein
VDHALPLTARACYFNSGALAVGFAVLMSSELSMLQRFGGLVTLAAVCSYLMALIMVPALFAAGRAISARSFRAAPRVAASAAVIVLLAGAGLLWSEGSIGAEDMPQVDGTAIATRIAERAEGDSSRRVVDIITRDRRGKTRERTALVLKHNDGDQRVTRFTYLAPKSVKDVTFLSHDRLDPTESDDRWLFLPATRKVRRIPASDRGDYFLGTDFTYEDIQSEFKLALSDYHFVLEDTQITDGGTVYVLSGKPRSDAIARELGYGGFRARVNGSNWLFHEVEFLDLDGERLKTVTIHSAEDFDGVWCATDIEVINHQTSHETRFVYQDVDYDTALPAGLFEANTLNRGLPPQYLP